MDLIELIKTRRTVHNFKMDPLPKLLLEQAIELATWAPNHKNTYPWRFYLMGPKSRKLLIDLALHVEKEKTKGELKALQVESIQKKISNCPEIIVIARKKEENHKIAKEDYASLACAIQNICLFLWQRGVGTKWSTGALTRHSDLNKILNVEVGSIELEGFLWVGYPEYFPKAPPKTTVSNIFFKTD